MIFLFLKNIILKIKNSYFWKHSYFLNFIFKNNKINFIVVIVVVIVVASIVTNSCGQIGLYRIESDFNNGIKLVLNRGGIFTTTELTAMVYGLMYCFSSEPLLAIIKTVNPEQVAATAKAIVSRVKPLSTIRFVPGNGPIMTFFFQNLGLRTCLANDYLFSLIDRKQLFLAQAGSSVHYGTKFYETTQMWFNFFNCGPIGRMTQTLLQKGELSVLKETRAAVWKQINIDPNRFWGSEANRNSIDLRYLSSFGKGVLPNRTPETIEQLSIYREAIAPGQTPTMSAYLRNPHKRFPYEVEKYIPVETTNNDLIDWKLLGLVAVGVCVRTVVYYYLRVDVSKVGQGDLFDFYLRQQELGIKTFYKNFFYYN